jgi:hypothetical protein
MFPGGGGLGQGAGGQRRGVGDGEAAAGGGGSGQHEAGEPGARGVLLVFDHWQQGDERRAGGAEDGGDAGRAL